MMAKFIVLAFALCAITAQGAELQQRANPIRKVVTMLQMMQQKVTEEGEKEKELYDKFMCYCKTSGGDLSKSIAEAEAKIPELESSIEESEEQMSQLKEDVEQHKADREAAKKAMAEATAIREKDAADFAAVEAEAMANIASIKKAVAALEKGVAGAFLQTGAANSLRKLVSENQDMDDDDRNTLLSFLSAGNSNNYAPQSGEIIGILKEMGDEMTKAYEEAKAEEEASVKEYEALMVAKKKEVVALTKSIEVKLERIGELGVSIAEMKNDLTDTTEALAEDKKFYAALEKGCETKAAEFEESTKTRAEELLALAETIKVLNDDDALELFKKTLPSAAASFMQVQVTFGMMRKRALEQIHQLQARNIPGRQQLDFIGLALRNKKVGFDKVIGMIDDMASTLKMEQEDDDKKKKDCANEFDVSDDKKKELEHELSDIETMMAETEESIAALTSDIESLIESIKSLDKSVAEATANRKAEHEEYKQLMAEDGAAKELLEFAKNRLNKFYNPKLYKAPPKRELTDEDRATLAGGGELDTTPPPGGIAGTGITVLSEVSAHHQDTGAPPPPPETFGAYTKKTEESKGVISYIDILKSDLDKEMTEAETSEKLAQEEYEKMIADAAETRAMDSKTLAEKEGAKAEAESTLEEHKASKTATKKELAATLKYIQALHMDCDWLLKFFDPRKEARASEIDALGKAKAVLSGADYSFLQMKTSHRRLRGDA